MESSLSVFFAEAPLADYSSFFNVHRVDITSSESGVDNDPTLGIERDTALDMASWGGGVERLLEVDVDKALTAASDAPDVDQVLAIANSTKHGGAGCSDLATVSGGYDSAGEIALHEFGHSFADLADEYDYGDGAMYTGPEPVRANASIYDATTMAGLAAKWHLWLDEPNVDTFEGAMYCESGIYRPTDNSKMRGWNRPFEQVNVEQFVVNMYKSVRPIDSSTPSGTYPKNTVFSVDPNDPTSHPLDVQWYLDANPIAGATNTVLDTSVLDLPVGTYPLFVEVADDTDLVRDEVLREEWMTEERAWTLEISTEIHGTIWNDLNADGIWSDQEPGLPGRTIFLDLNANEAPDAGEPTAVTTEGADPVEDQSQTASDCGFWFEQSVVRWQEFAAGLPWIRQIDILMSRGENPGDMWLGIERISYGSLLWSESIAQAATPTYGWRWQKRANSCEA